MGGGDGVAQGRDAACGTQGAGVDHAGQLSLDPWAGHAGRTVGDEARQHMVVHDPLAVIVCQQQMRLGQRAHDGVPVLEDTRGRVRLTWTTR